MQTSRHQKLTRRKQRIQYRLRPLSWRARATPMLTDRAVQYELSERVRGLGGAHVLGIAYNILCGGTCLQDIEFRR